MILVPTDDPIYFNTRRWFRNKLISFDPRVMGEIGDFDVYFRYKHWLAKQGAQIIKHPNRTLITDWLGVAPGYDKFEFQREQDATMFILRWS